MTHLCHLLPSSSSSLFDESYTVLGLLLSLTRERAAQMRGSYDLWAPTKNRSTRPTGQQQQQQPANGFVWFFIFFWLVSYSLCVWMWNLETQPSFSVFECAHDSATKEREAERVSLVYAVRRSSRFFFPLDFGHTSSCQWWWWVTSRHSPVNNRITWAKKSKCFQDIWIIMAFLPLVSFVKRNRFDDAWHRKFAQSVTWLIAMSDYLCVAYTGYTTQSRRCFTAENIPFESTLKNSHFLYFIFIIEKEKKHTDYGCVSVCRFHLNNTQQNTRSYRDKRAGVI